MCVSVCVFSSSTGRIEQRKVMAPVNQRKDRNRLEGSGEHANVITAILVHSLCSRSLKKKKK